MRRTPGKLGAMVTMSLLLWSSPLSSQEARATKKTPSEEKVSESLLAKEVRHQLQVLPFYSVFDILSFTMQGDDVTISGQVVRPTLKADALAAIRSLEGIGKVSDQIEVLPISATDDELRRATYRAIYEDSTLKRYAIRALPAIHMIVKNGVVTLEGTVDSEADKSLAGMLGSSANPARLQNNLGVHRPETPIKIVPQ